MQLLIGEQCHNSNLFWCSQLEIDTSWFDLVVTDDEGHEVQCVTVHLASNNWARPLIMQSLDCDTYQRAILSIHCLMFHIIFFLFVSNCPRKSVFSTWAKLELACKVWKYVISRMQLQPNAAWSWNSLHVWVELNTCLNSRTSKVMESRLKIGFHDTI